MEHSTIAAIATAPGAGGIAVVRLSGPESYAVAAKVFHPANPSKRVEDAKGYTALFGHFMEGEEAFDEGVALFFRAPHSYTGEDVVELSCHGGSAVARRLVESCIAAGAAPAAPGEYTRRAFLNGKLGLTQAEAVMDLISADGRQGAALANASLNGALAKKIGAEKDALTALQAHLTAWVDFPEEDVPALEDAQLVSTLTAVKSGRVYNTTLGILVVRTSSSWVSRATIRVFCWMARWKNFFMMKMAIKSASAVFVPEKYLVQNWPVLAGRQVRSVCVPVRTVP